MLHQIISPENFKTIPWKNGKGSTVELAISSGASLDNFDWRLSMADVIEDGEFSDFSGYLRNLILIKGSGLLLEHDCQATDSLNEYLSFATFSGSNKTFGKLTQDAITDFNIITRSDKYNVEVQTFPEQATTTIPSATLVFVFSLGGQSVIEIADELQVNLPKRHLLILEELNPNKPISISGHDLIIARLSGAVNN